MPTQTPSYILKQLAREQQTKFRLDDELLKLEWNFQLDAGIFLSSNPLTEMNHYFWGYLSCIERNIAFDRNGNYKRIVEPYNDNLDDWKDVVSSRSETFEVGERYDTLISYWQDDHKKKIIEQVLSFVNCIIACMFSSFSLYDVILNVCYTITLLYYAVPSMAYI